jgi:hypothetical protein
VGDRAVLTMGEVHTGLLQHSVAVSGDFVHQLLTPARGLRVRRADRPIAYALSPDHITGVDCELATTNGAKVRGVGTVVSRVALTGGHVVQGSAFVQVSRGEAGRRLPWSHYMARPGAVETLGKMDTSRLVGGFFEPYSTGPLLDLGAIVARTMDAVHISQLLDHRPVLKSSRTRLRWVAETSDMSRSISFTVYDELLRTVRLHIGCADVVDIATLCEDLALHDWLLTTLLSHVGRARIGTTPRSAVVGRLQPTIDHLIHLWMPVARVDPALVDLWQSLDRHLGLTRQWQATVDRVRDQLALANLEVLSHSRQLT